MLTAEQWLDNLGKAAPDFDCLRCQRAQPDLPVIR